MGINKIGVIGVGQMGGGIVQIAASAGYEILACDQDEAHNQKAQAKLEKSLSKLVEKGKIEAAQKDEVLAKVKWTTQLQDFADCPLIIEAITEDVPAKVALFKELDQICSADTILATNTSSISVTRLAGATQRANKVIGMHFFNPVPVMKLLEVIRALQTDDETYQTILEIGEKLNKKAVTVQDSAAFVVNRLLIPFLNEAFYAVYEGVSTGPDIDIAVKAGLNHPMGPFELADFVGLDTLLAALEVMQNEFGDSKYRPCPLLRKHVESGWLGRKTGRGFYNYS
ncbi:MAG: NAD(P)-binding domain-containing protein [Deltaproteobacteria bacterium]|nr:NAD(P)-binding domain-containing protein [Deltaproteobacteria bacterium]